jgi:deoxycytidylate deaminase
MVYERMVTAAVEEARKSTYKIQMGCIIFKKKDIVSRGRNYAQRGCRKIKKEFLRWENSIHAEIDAVIKARTDLKGFSILVVRINNTGQLRLAKPCENCLKYLKHVGIKSIYYSISKYPYIEKLGDC